MIARPALARTTLPLVATLVASACAGGPTLARDVEIAAGEPTRVLLTQVKDGTAFLLQNASSVDAAAFYSAHAPDVLGKVVADDRLQALLDVFSERGMFAAAPANAPPDARDVLAVEHGGRRWVWYRRRAGVQPEEAVFHEARAYFLEVYNAGTAYRGGDPRQRPDLAGEQDRIQRDADAAKGRLERLGRRPQ